MFLPHWWHLLWILRLWLLILLRCGLRRITLIRLGTLLILIVRCLITLIIRSIRRSIWWIWLWRHRWLIVLIGLLRWLVVLIRLWWLIVLIGLLVIPIATREP